MTQRTRKSFLFAGFAVFMAIASLAVGNLFGGDSDTDADLPAVTLPQELEVLLLRAGLDPACLAAAGVSSGQLSAQLADAESDLGAALTALGTADADYSAARVDRDRLRRLVRSGQGTGEDVAALTIAKAQLADAEAARASALDAAFSGATSNLSDVQVATLTQIRANGNWKWCPVQYRVLDQGEADWLALRDALAGIHSHERIGDEAPQACLDYIATCDADSAVSTALSNCNANTSSLEATWDATFVD